MKGKSLAVAALALACILPAKADLIFTYTNGAFGAGNYGTVLLHQSGAGAVDVTVTLINNQTITENFIQTGSHFTFAFNLNNIAPVTITGLDTTNYMFVEAPAGNPGENNNPPANGNFDYQIDCYDNNNNGCTNPGSSILAGPLKFTVNGAGLTESSFIASDNDTVFFSSDIFRQGATGAAATGVVEAFGPGDGQNPPVPEPASLALFGSGVSLVAFQIRRRFKK